MRRAAVTLMALSVFTMQLSAFAAEDAEGSDVSGIIIGIYD